MYPNINVTPSSLYGERGHKDALYDAFSRLIRPALIASILEYKFTELNPVFNLSFSRNVQARF